MNSYQTFAIVETDEKLRTGEQEANGTNIQEAEAVFKSEILYINESHSLCEEVNDITVKEENLSSEDDADNEFYKEYVKSEKCESVQSDSDVSFLRIKNIVHEDSKYFNNSTKSKEKKQIGKNKTIKTKKFKCTFCKKEYQSEITFEDHLKIHTEPEMNETILEINATDFAPSINLKFRADWNDAATKLLIFIYKCKSKSIGKNKQFSSFTKFWDYVAKEIMQQQNFFFTGDQVKNKWDALVRSYKDVIKNNKETGRKRKKCPYQNELEEIFLQKRNIFPEFLASGITESTHTNIIGSRTHELPEEKTQHQNLSVQTTSPPSSTSTQHTNLPLPSTLTEAKKNVYIAPTRKLREMLENHHRERMEATKLWREQKLSLQKEKEENRHKERMALIKVLKNKK